MSEKEFKKENVCWDSFYTYKRYNCNKWEIGSTTGIFFFTFSCLFTCAFCKRACFPCLFHQCEIRRAKSVRTLCVRIHRLGRHHTYRERPFVFAYVKIVSQALMGTGVEQNEGVVTTIALI